MADESVRRLEEWLDAYAAGDREALGALLADDAVWHVAGTHRLSGDYRGREAILGYFDTVGQETHRTLRLEVLADERHGAMFLRVTAEHEGRELDVVVADAFRFDESGRILEFWAHANDQAAIDRFWG